MFYCILILLATLTLGCPLAGQEIGHCQSKDAFGMDSFCGESLEANVCVPLASAAWPEYSTVKYRDQQIQDIFMFYIQNRLLQEYIHVNVTQILSNNQNCYSSYRKFLCQFNFPRCNPDTSETFPVCKSVCVAFFENCASSSDACDIIYAKKLPKLDYNC